MKKLFLLTVVTIQYFAGTAQSNAYGLKGFGDSITWGLGSSIGSYDNDSCWFGRLRLMMGLPAHNYGVPGSILYSQDPSWVGIPGQNLLDKTATSLSSDLPLGYATFMIGTNDHVINIPAWKAAYKARVQDFITAGYNPQKIVICAPAWNSMWSMAWAQPVTQQIATELGTLWADTYTLTTNHPEWLSDNLHPNNTGYLAMATYIYNVIQSSNTVLPVKFKSIKISKKN